MENPNLMQGRICLITGANSGIGKATARGLAKLGAIVVMVCLDAERGNAARAEIAQASGNPRVDLFIADLASQTAIRELACELHAKYPALHVLINNAGANIGRRTLTADGIEKTFAVNQLAPFLLTTLLLDTLRASAPARIVNITTGLRHPIDFDDLAREKKYAPLEVYQESKMANLLFTYELARRIEGSGVTVNCVMPGLVRTNLGRDVHGFFRVFLKMMQPFSKSPERGAEDFIYAAAALEMETVNGKYLQDRKIKLSGQESTLADAERLWGICEKMTKMSAHGGTNGSARRA